MRNLYDRYLRGVGDLLRAIEQTDADYLTVLTLQGRLAQAISEIRQYGPTDSARAEIARVTTGLDSLCLTHLGRSFRTICGVDESPGADLPKIYHNLPQPDYDQFVGREQELAKIYDLLSPTNRHFLVTIDGIGGIGKSALALEVAHHYLHDAATLPETERFDAIIWTSARQSVLTAGGIVQRKQALRTLDDIYAAISVTLGREDVTRALLEQQHEIIRKILTRQRVLLVVDNLEAIDDETVIEFLREIPTPTKSIVTTRHRLDVAYPVRLTGMPWDDAKALIAQECQKKDVKLTDEQAQKLYHHTGGVPLAVVWSVAQMGFGYGVETVLTQLSRPEGDIARFCFESAMKHVHDTDAHKLLMALALIAAGTDRETLGRVAGLDEDVLSRDQGLAELERLSLINNRAGLFSMLPLTRAYVSDELREHRRYAEEAMQRWIPVWFQKNPQLYIEGSADTRVYEEVLRGGTISIQGARQTGKTSLLERVLQSAEAEGRIVVRIDLGLFREESLANLDSLLRSIAEAMVAQLEIRIPWESLWNKRLGPSDNLTTLIETALSSLGSPIILSLDSIDRLIPLQFKSPFFSMLRSWHNNRAVDELWGKLTVIMAYRSEPYQLIDDLTRSPFNVGLRIKLDDFDDEQITKLNRRYGSPLRTIDELKRLQGLVGGHPYLLQTAFYALAVQERTLDNLLDATQSLDGPFGSHLRECEAILAEDPKLQIAFEEVISSGTCSDQTAALTLRSLGFVLPKAGTDEIFPRCGLYVLHFGKKQRPSYFFVAGGTLRPDQPSYLTRDADTLLLESVRKGIFCYVLEPRQTGKSSLMIRVGSNLRNIGYEPVFIDLTAMGIDAPEPFVSLLHMLGRQLGLKEDLQKWWDTCSRLNTRDKLISFSEERLLLEDDKYLVLFVDEVDSVLRHPFLMDELLGFVRFCYTQRSTDPRFKRLNFVVSGVGDPFEIFAGKNHVLRESGVGIHLRDFSRDEIELLLAGFDLDSDLGKTVLDRVYWWTDGHPYLTQKLCLAVSESLDLPVSDAVGQVDRIVQRLFLREEANKKESNLRFMANFLLRDPHRYDILQLYERILGDQVSYDEMLSAHRRLRASGMIKETKGQLKIRNRIYETVFDRQWIDENLSPLTRLLSRIGLSRR